MNGQAVTVFPGVRLLYCGNVVEVVELEGLAVTLRNERTGEFSTLPPGRLVAGARSLEERPEPDGQDASVLLANLSAPQQAALHERAGHVREVLTGYRSGDEGRAPGDEPLPAAAELAFEFLQIKPRTIQHYGVDVDGMRYNGPALDGRRGTTSPYGGRLAGRWPIRVNPDDVRFVHFQDPDDGSWHALQWEHAPALNMAFSAEAAAYARRLAARTGRHIDASEALGELLARWDQGLVTDRRERRMAVRLSAERAALSLPTLPDQTVQAQRYLHHLLTGSDLADPAHPLAWQSARDRSRYLAYLPTLTLDQRHALHTHARALLDRLGIAEPLTWEPPEQCAAGLSLPGRPLTDINLDALKHIVFTEQRTPRDAARELGTTITHVRFGLERIGAKPQEWTSRHPPLASWRLRKRAQTILTPEFFEREYTQQEKTLAQIAQEVDLPRHIVIEQANAVGLTIPYSRRPVPIDENRLREQHLTRKRSTYGIAQEIGTEDETVRRRLRRLGVPLRSQGVHSRTVMTAKLDRSVPRDVRAAVEATLHGWLRLHRFQIAMAFPNLTTAGAYLACERNAPTTQFKRLETDIGHTLHHRSVQTRPHRPALRGHSLLQTLTRPQIQKLTNDALTPDQIHPQPDATTLAEAAATARRRRPRGPLTPFDGIAVERIRIRQETLTLLNDLLSHADEGSYGAQIHARTGLSQGTVSDQLRRRHHAGWLTSRPEDDVSWRNRAPATRGPGRRRVYYALTPEGRRAAEHELQQRSTQLTTLPAAAAGRVSMTAER